MTYPTSVKPARQRTGAERFSFVSHWFYDIISFGGHALPAPVAELGRSPLSARAMTLRHVLFFAAALSLVSSCSTAPKKNGQLESAIGSIYGGTFAAFFH